MSAARNFLLRGFEGDDFVLDAHPLDMVIARLARGSKMFYRGWGDAGLLARSAERSNYLEPAAPIEVQWISSRKLGKKLVRDGSFPSPENWLPGRVRTAHVRSWTCAGNSDACLLLAASRDEGYRVREYVFGELVDRGTDLYLLENPFYGLRRTATGPCLSVVSDHVLMVTGILQEARGLLAWLHTQYRKLAVAGYSMGGHMAAIAAGTSRFPIACAAMATGASASTIYISGLLSWSVDFEALRESHGSRVAARERLRELFDLANVTRYPRPERCDAAIIGGCKQDGYVASGETQRLHEYWQGSELRWIDGGHFSPLVTQRAMLRKCIHDALDTL